MLLADYKSDYKIMTNSEDSKYCYNTDTYCGFSKALQKWAAMRQSGPQCDYIVGSVFRNTNTESWYNSPKICKGNHRNCQIYHKI